MENRPFSLPARPELYIRLQESIMSGEMLMDWWVQPLPSTREFEEAWEEYHTSLVPHDDAQRRLGELGLHAPGILRVAAQHP